MTRVWIAFVVTAAVACCAFAHQYVPNDLPHTSPETALVIADPYLSQVVYHPVEDGRDQLWLALDLEAGTDLYCQLGLPFLARLADYRPALALVGQGLSGGSVPWTLTEGLGAQVIPLDNEATYFDEPFTGTESLILLERDVPIPATGRYYLVAYHPDNQSGKLWVAVGRREEFGLEALLTYSGVLDRVRAFHEVDDEPLPPLPRLLNGLSLLLQFLFMPCR